MPAVVIGVESEHEIRVPEWIMDLDSFHRWVESEDFPQEGRIDYIKGEIWVDMSYEQVFSHNQVKTEYTYVLTGLAKRSRLGRYFADGLRIRNRRADLSNVPDGTYISNKSLREGRARLLKGSEGGYIGVEGSADMVLEIVSASSVTKDTVHLPELYAEAGISEYWLVDVRRERLEFNIFRLTREGYVATRKKGAWLKSEVFGKSFRLTRGEDDLGNPEYSLEAR